METPYPAPSAVRGADTAALFPRIYGWMTAGLLVTAAVALLVSTSEAVLSLVFGNRLVFFGAILVELGVVAFLSARIHVLSQAAAAGLFLFYAALNGVTISVILLVYTAASVASVFLITGLTFALMSVIGMTTKRDLSGWGGLLMMGVVGLVVALVVNLFLGSDTLAWVISLVGVGLFVALTAYDTQKLKALAAEVDGPADTGRLAILGALTLYLDFINLFLFLVRLLGRRR